MLSAIMALYQRYKGAEIRGNLSMIQFGYASTSKVINQESEEGIAWCQFIREDCVTYKIGSEIYLTLHPSKRKNLESRV